MGGTNNIGLKVMEGDNWIDGNYIITEKAINNSKFGGKNVAWLHFMPNVDENS